MAKIKYKGAANRKWKDSTAWSAWSEIVKWKGATPTQMTPMALASISNYVESLEDAVDRLWDQIRRQDSK